MTRTISIWWLVVSTPRQIGNCIQIRVTPNYPKKVTIAALPVIEYDASFLPSLVVIFRSKNPIHHGPKFRFLG